MTKRLKRWTGLFVLCLLLAGCGGEETPAISQTTKNKQPEDQPNYAEVVVEVVDWQYFPDNLNSQKSLLQPIVSKAKDQLIDAWSIETDRQYEQTGQMRILVEPIEQADIVFEFIRDEFNGAARSAVLVEFLKQQAEVKAKSEEFQKYQQLMKQFQQGVPSVEIDGKKIDRRKLDRLIENSLSSRIEAEKLAEALQRQIERERFATLTRLK